jgi:hypothetical protein
MFLFRLLPDAPSHGQHALAILISLAVSLPAVSQAREKREDCISVEHIEGVYHCAGECVLRANDGGNRVVEISGEVDEISRIEGARTGLYQSSISGAGGFSELEIGALFGRVMRTATAKVSDGHFPVLEEYLFEHDASCSATAYTKIVRNPTRDQFKACNIRCEKQP